MVARAHTQQQLDQLAAQGVAEIRARFGNTLEQQSPANGENAIHLSEPEVLEFRGLRYHVPPVSFPAGLHLGHLAAQVDAAVEAGEDAQLRAFYELADYAWSLIWPKPTGWRRFVALFHRRPANPFRQANQKEILAVLRFFARLQTTSSVRFRFQQDGSPGPTSYN